MSTVQFAAMLTAGWAMAHPVWLLVFGALMVLVTLAAAVVLADDRADQKRYAARPPRHATPRQPRAARTHSRPGVTIAGDDPNWAYVLGHPLAAVRARTWAVAVLVAQLRALADQSYETTEAEDAYMDEHHPAAMLTVGPPDLDAEVTATRPWAEDTGTFPAIAAGWGL